MATKKARQAIFFTALLGITGLMVVIPKLSMGQANPPATTTQSEELAEAEKLDQQIIQFYEQGKYNEAIPLAERVLAMRKRLLGVEHLDVADSLNNLAELYYSQVRYKEVETYYIQALEMRKRLFQADHADIADSLNNLAFLYYSQARYKEAETYYIQALEMRKRLFKGDHADIATNLNNLAGLWESQARYKVAETYYIQALEMTKRLFQADHSDIATSLNNLALLYQRQGRDAEVETHYVQALEMRKRLFQADHSDIANSLNNLGFFYTYQRRYAEADAPLRQALEMRKRLFQADHSDIANSLNNLAFLYYSQARYKEAEIYYIQVRDMYKRLLGKEHPLLANNLNNLAALYKRQRLYDNAKIHYLQARDMYKRLLGKEHPLVATSLNNLAALYQSQGNIINALDFLTQGIEIEESNLTYNLSAGFERQKRDYIKTISGTTNATISLHLNSASNNQKTARLAFTTLLQRKGRILDILTNNLQILRQRVNEPESLKLIDELSIIYSQLASLIYNPSAQLLSNYRQQVEQLEDKAKRKEDELSRRSAEFRLQSQPVSVEAIQKLIPSDAALVELVRYQPFNPKAPEKDRFGELRYAAYILNSSGEPQGIDLGEAKEIETAFKLFRQDVRDSQTPNIQLKQSARNLDKIVMQPIRKLLGNTRKILISPDGALNLIPFEALVDENNKYLIENYSFTYLTSGRDLLRLQTSFPSKQPPVIMADPYFERMATVTTIQGQNRSINLSKKYFPPLPETAEEAKAIGSLLSIGLGIGIEPLIGSQASKGNLQQLKSPQILHIATHGFFESPKQEDKNTFEDNPLLLSGLVLAGLKKPQVGSNENGILTALETTSLNLLGTKLVVLFACDTGIGKDSTGEGVYGLRRALVIAGSESQVISLWKVDDNATKDLMVDYYKGLVAKHGRSEALRQTQLKMLRGELGKEYQHPYYWAAFIPSGDWRPMGR
ncbi:tetratricopeptide repeat protein [Dolichospermum circinale CS-534/05]|uniref:CHAT domain-containing tetratricopeptide repeat protein n=1 Tax=Dolichospermum circinale TaxID=109265 RepID=UPI0023306DC9|nr:tetratricopeptide repeat protein [Dolichospermum circinale]MDB9492181.1 tetratricopeptide repeat protein [Dolichospermum circinale CS-534/05]